MRIFVVDDEIALVSKLEKIVKKARPNDEILSFDDPVTALENAQIQNPDIVFTDIEMPKMKGIVLAQKLKELNKDIKIIFCTAYSEYALKAFELHANGYLMKPYSEEEIKNELDNILTPQYLPNQKRIYIQTFGLFDLFLDNKIVKFSRNRSKEILAYLVSKKGSEVSMNEIVSALWEDDSDDEKYKKQLYVYISDLKNDLEKLKIDDILIKTKNGYALDKHKVDCDYYRLIDGDVAIINKYEGEFMSQYSWAENINAYIGQNI